MTELFITRLAVLFVYRLNMVVMESVVLVSAKVLAKWNPLKSLQ